MRARHGRSLGLAALLALGACTSSPEATNEAVRSPTDRGAAFATAVFADISEERVSDQVAAEFQAALKEMAGGAGMAATVMSPDGTWSGAPASSD